MRGQSTTITLEYDVGDVAVADPAVCDYVVGQERRSLYLNARGGGETILTLWDAAGDKRDEIPVRVVTTTLKEALDRARQDFGDYEGVGIEVRGGHVEIAGDVAEPDDFRRIEGAAKADPRLKSRVRLAPEAIGRQAEAVAKAIDTPGIFVRAVRDRVVLEGVAYSPADARRAVEIAKLYAPEVLDLIEVRETGRRIGRGRMIELAFHLMEIKRSALRELGIGWAPGASPAGAATAVSGGGGLLSSLGDMGRQLLGFVFQLVPKLKRIRERGDGRVLENPSVVVKSGEEAKVFSGSEVPYYKGEEVQFKRVGIEIEATPVETAGGIDLKLSATLSAPASDLRGAIDTHTVSTTALCPLGQSLVLGNIVRNGEVKMRNRAPRGLDTSSALFALFLSKDFQSNRSEFVIFVTPRLVEQPSPAKEELRAFLATEEAMIRERSRREFAEYAKKQAGLEGAASAPRTHRTDGRAHRTRGGRRWR